MDQTLTVVILKYVKDYPDCVRLLGSSFLVIINQDKNIIQRMQPTAPFNLFVLYYWFHEMGQIIHESRMSFKINQASYP